MSQLIRITSEALQAQIRRLLPSQRGFGDDLQASNVIQPIIDLTPTAEGVNVPLQLQQAVGFGNTVFEIFNGTTTLASTAGFYRIFGVSNLREAAAGNISNSFSITDGLSTKKIWNHTVSSTTAQDGEALGFDFIVWLRPGDSVTGTSNNDFCLISGNVRQIADTNGTLQPPLGFSPQ